ncbi:alpha/beta-hydrolases superfamily protein [Anaeramoeba flamelloides]|uniref:Alpha/beta-hydrolases superfamily protein n=1 Tax=Anaeramoeba flamelloides TaxID=1746091 RepID=A0ABQ8YQF9_9EUKA|nr:alpha/beta-hydrolases superfamily protein [Anaeramoeba flamelloides]
MHIIFTVHGLGGLPKNHHNLQKILAGYAKKKNKDVAIIISQSNRFTKSLSSISVCGLRLANEIKKEFVLASYYYQDKKESERLNQRRTKTKTNKKNRTDEKHQERVPIINQLDSLDHDENLDLESTKSNFQKNIIIGQKPTYFSIIGHSLGGLIVRYALYLLYKENWFTKNHIVCKNLVTFATPHLGARKIESKNYFDKLFNKVAISFGKSCNELTLTDAKEGDEPLLVKMTSKEFLKPLRLFQHRGIYGNLLFDWKVGFETALIIPACRENDKLKVKLGRQLKRVKIFNNKNKKKKKQKLKLKQKKKKKKQKEKKIHRNQNNKLKKKKKKRLSLKYYSFLDNLESNDEDLENFGITSSFFEREEEDIESKTKTININSGSDSENEDDDNLKNRFFISNNDLQEFRFREDDIIKKNYFGDDEFKNYYIKMLGRLDKVDWERTGVWFQDKKMIRKLFVHERMLQLHVLFDKTGFLLIHSFASKFDF